MKVRKEMASLSLNIQKIDAQPPGAERDTLTREGGQTKVPCLKISNADGSAKWLYESKDIITYLQQQFAKV